MNRLKWPTLQALAAPRIGCHCAYDTQREAQQKRQQ